MLPPGLPELPDGFTWKIIKETQIPFPIPDRWYFQEEKQGNTYSYFATKENIARPGVPSPLRPRTHLERRCPIRATNFCLMYRKKDLTGGQKPV